MMLVTSLELRHAQVESALAALAAGPKTWNFVALPWAAVLELSI